MVHTLEPLEARDLLAREDLDLVDVRDPHEWSDGHLPGARNVPLDRLRTDPRAHLPRDRVLLVCARGARSLTAAAAAESAGVREVYSLTGGTLAWRAAGLPIESPPPAVEAPSPPTATAVTGPDEGAACGLPEPGLDAVVGANLQALRTRHGLSLDELARRTGVSRSLLGQIELGRVSPGVGVVWQIARAFDVPFSALLVSTAPTVTTVFPAAQARRIASPDGRFSSRALYNPAAAHGAEFYELVVGPHSREDAHPHQPGTRENLVVAAGRLDVEVAGTRYELHRGDALEFGADVAHAYVNPTAAEARVYLVMTYGARTA